MIMRKSLLIFLTSVIALLIVACKPQVPGKYLQPGEMEDILYDYHLAISMAQDENTPDGNEADGTNEERRLLYEELVLRKHGVTRADFDSALVYYTRHSDRFHSIYENISKRLSEEAVSLGGTVGDLARFDGNTSDTTNIWKQAPSAVLTTREPYNVETFYVKADTTFHKGDKLVFLFKATFIFQDGYKNGEAVMAVRFQNDSVATRSVRLSESRQYDLTVSDDARLGIKEMRGFITLLPPQNDTESTMKLMFVDNIRLIKNHTKNEKGTPAPAGIE